MVVCPGALAVAAAGNQLRAADQADHIAVFLLLRHGLPLVEDEAHQPPVLLHLVAQALRVITVYLHIAVKGLHLHRPVEGVVAVPCLVVLEQVARIVVLEGGGHAAPGQGHQAVAGVVLVQFLLAAHQTPGAVARLVVEQLLGIGRVVHPLELIEGIVLVQGRPVQGLFSDSVAVSIIGIAGMGEQGLPGADGEARQVLVQVVGILLPDGAVGQGFEGASVLSAFDTAASTISDY